MLIPFSSHFSSIFRHETWVKHGETPPVLVRQGHQAVDLALLGGLGGTSHRRPHGTMVPTGAVWIWWLFPGPLVVSMGFECGEMAKMAQNHGKSWVYHGLSAKNHGKSLVYQPKIMANHWFIMVYQPKIMANH